MWAVERAVFVLKVVAFKIDLAANYIFRWNITRMLMWKIDKAEYLVLAISGWAGWNVDLFFSYRQAPNFCPSWLWEVLHTSRVWHKALSIKHFFKIIISIFDKYYRFYTLNRHHLKKILRTYTLFQYIFVVKKNINK